jgi:4-hydroxy-tetrahydrodipicolinate synthase
MNAIKATAAGGNWPVMITPFNEDKSIDWKSLDRLIEWYLGADVSGLFAVCQSSEMFNLSTDERLRLAKHVVERVKGRVPVIATGTFPENDISQAEMVKRMYDLGLTAVIILSNLFAEEHESESVWIKNVEKLLQATKQVPLGIYECPFPYKRLIPAETLAWAESTGRFFWAKDTSENINQIREKLKVTRGTNLSLYNAHTGSLLESLRAGIMGFAGIDSNFYPHLYSWMCKNWKHEATLAEELQNFFNWGRKIIDHKYSLSAKEYLLLLGIIKNSTTRIEKEKFTADERETLRKMYRETGDWLEKLGLSTDKSGKKQPQLAG